MRGNRPLALGGVLVSGFGFLVGFGLVLGLLVFFSLSSCSVSFPFNDDLGTPPTRRPYSWKKSLQGAASVEGCAAYGHLCPVA